MRKSVGIMLVALVATMSFLGIAVATEVASQPDAAMPAPMVVVDEAAGTISIALPIDGEYPECFEDQTAGDTSEGCFELVIEHPSARIETLEIRG